MIETSAKRLTLWITSGIATVLLGISIGAAAPAAADEPTPTPTPVPAGTSTSDEIADMVMDAIGSGVTAPAISSP